ncbi:hypothetical protein FA15DRAFT_661908 [Coprinopsis marcescibilis]|uniref:Fungal-type protein kinase domain-containing protein n=1 Tax=Coprinopsis marcescibilis TaxID=230819 RepID=A0A5C3KAC1_COPMA|nr:hypothetical protein FA15DRAFT_661908 [Coprinopsis marcescibilis]
MPSEPLPPLPGNSTSEQDVQPTKPWYGTIGTSQKQCSASPDPLSWPACKKLRYFGHVHFCFAYIFALITKGMVEDQRPDGQPPCIGSDQRFYQLYQKLLKLVQKLDVQLANIPEPSDIKGIADQIQKGISNARADDTKSLKCTIIEWIAPEGQALNPPLKLGVKVLSSALVKGKKEVLIAGDDWPLFLYKNEIYDHEDPWKVLRNVQWKYYYSWHEFNDGCFNCNVATQVWFALCSASVFSHTDQETDSELFYSSVLELLEDRGERNEIRELLKWWNKTIFPSFTLVRRKPGKNSVLARIKTRRITLRESLNNTDAPDDGQDNQSEAPVNA